MVVRPSATSLSAYPPLLLSINSPNITGHQHQPISTTPQPRQTAYPSIHLNNSLSLRSEDLNRTLLSQDIITGKMIASLTKEKCLIETWHDFNLRLAGCD